MKNKKVTYLLLILTVVIWGTIGWKVYNALKDDSIPVMAVNERVAPQKESDPIRLILNYRDPFLGDYNESKRPISSNSQIATIANNKQPVPSEPEVLPNFRYKGIIRVGTETKAMVNISGETVLFGINEHIGDFMISGISDEKLVVKRNKKEYSLPLQ